MYDYIGNLRERINEEDCTSDCCGAKVDIDKQLKYICSKCKEQCAILFGEENEMP